MSPRPELAVVVGAYNPIPCDTSISLADVYSPDSASSIDENEPRLSDGTPVQNCATGPWKNLLLVAAQRQEIDRIWLTADMPASIAASSQDGLGADILARIADHPAPDVPLPVANIIIDMAAFGDDDGYSSADYFDAVSFSFVGLVDDALQASGYQTVLTYDRPWTGGASDLTYILTPGGNEETGDGTGMGPPYWSSAQELPADLLALLDPANHPGPVFLHPVFGVPEAGNWADVRGRFGMPGRFSYRNPTLTSSDEYQTSLVTSLPVTPDGDVLDDAPMRPITPESATLLGHSMLLRSFSDFNGLGQLANFVSEDEVPQDRVVASGPLLLPGPIDVLQERSAHTL